LQRKPASDLIRGEDRFASGKRVTPKIQTPGPIPSERLEHFVERAPDAQAVGRQFVHLT
jgi:hypothetical protein